MREGYRLCSRFVGGVDWDYKHLHLKVFEDTEVEMHYVPEVFLNLWKNRKLQKWFKESEVSSSMFQVAGSLVCPSVDFNLFYILLHTYRHFLYEGVGLRQLMDYYFVVKHEKEVKKGLNVQEVKKVVSELGFDCFAFALMWILGDVFGLSIELMPWQPCKEDGRIILAEVMQSGNFGKQDARAGGVDDSKWKSFWFVNDKTFRFWRFDHWAWFWSPLWRVYHNIRKKTKGFE